MKANVINVNGVDVEIEGTPSDNSVTTQKVADKAITKAKLAEPLQGEIDGKYAKPSSGIPASDIAPGVIPDVSQFITKSADNLLNYYLKSETYTKAEVQALVNAVKQFTYEAVSVLPAASASTMHKIYLVPSSNPKLKNVKDEFITIDNGASAETRYTWEQIGSTEIDLSNYHTIAQETAAINAAIAQFKTETEIRAIVNGLLASYRTSPAQDAIDATKANKDGYYAGLSAGYADKAGDLDIQASAMVRHTQVKPMETTGGDKDVKDGAGFVRVIKGTENGITAAGAKIISLGFNLVPNGSGTSFTFRCVKGEWGAYGTSQKNNGYLFTDSRGNILVPSSVKQNGVAVPTHTDHGNTYYLPSQDGQCTVVFATSQTNPCAHLCWSNGRDTKDNYEAYNASQVDLSSAINAIGGTLRRVGYVFDEINIGTKQSSRRLGYRLLNALPWTMEAGTTPEEGEATNTFRAIVSGGVATADTIKAGGAFAIKGLTGLTFSLDGTSIVCDSTITSVAGFVTALGSGTIEYELAIPVVVANSLNGQIVISDYGIIIFENTAGASVVDIDFDFNQKWSDFIKNLPDDLEQMNDDRNSLRGDVEAIAEDVRGARDVATLPLLCGQPPVLYGAGEPAEAVVPDNWKQFDPATGEGYNWNGNPSALGQRYINVSAANGGYTAGRKSLVKTSADYYVLKWYKD